MKRFFLGAILALGLALAFISLSYFVIMDHLIVDETPKQADVIIVPEGMITEERAERAANLYRGGYSRSGKLIVSPYDQINGAYYAEHGVPESAIVNDATATSTYENATHSLKMMEEAGYSSALVVSSDYHMLRTKMIFERVNRRYGFDLTFVAAYHRQGDHWVTWKEGPDYIQDFAQQEFYKYWAYLLYLYHFVNH
ncbi:YdcF family protein [Aerococcus sanguinicola]|uniref:YdcF family protein n=1 Tax=Aerococcus sanguinicola TaxID=119206 RepID=A0A0X8FC61_9LACT|nr:MULTISPECIES: YdcF family protein [Aerococcus]AMB94558.1 hypothetical protein AWM72_07240 [Aerococcus sanguinicola]MDK7049439.1 YdcF family protein [Aerococcus sanguinicola]OFT96860.1 hypothetical protein HMPREF3090_01570 [Aerococcus sp. HMSC23C02]PKZ23446.1 YdcF family protein [Aerococcus sanguinicola]